MTRDYSAEFALDPDLIYLNHAAVAPWPARTAAAMQAYAQECATTGALHFPRWLTVEKRVREHLATLINAQPADIALLKNTSEALSAVAYGLDWNAGDNVVISDQEFPSNRIVWESLGARGVETRKVNLTSTRTPEEALLDALDARTRLLSISSVQFTTGLRLDLNRLGAGCRAHGALFCIDAIQSLGALRFDVAACHADFVAAETHKWMLGPNGIALFWCRPELRERLRLHQFGWHMVEHAGDYARTDWQPAATAQRFECGSPNYPGIHALDASLSLLLEVGMETIERNVLSNSEFLFGEIERLASYELLTDKTPGRYAGIVTLRHRKADSGRLFQYLGTNGVFCAQRGGGVRFSPHFYTPQLHLERTMSLLREFDRA